MFDLPSCEIRLSIVDGATGAGYKRQQLPVAHSWGPSDDYATDGIDLTDDVAAGVADDASREYRIPRRRTMACEMSAEHKLQLSVIIVKSELIKRRSRMVYGLH